ncbi:MAG: type II toxin-antitoxin system RelE/ParE family toxin [Thermoleophilia bacterium]|nr:type II toxin-antitoxin system RelE/ParE family toxin [Thermoleophilia bacterium]
MLEVEYTDQFGAWWREFDDDQQERVAAAVEIIEQGGPAVGRPLVDTLEGSRRATMKELRVGDLRALFAFDPTRRAVLLLGGDKTGRWREWYSQAVPLADRLYDEHLRRLVEEGLIDDD